MLTSVIDQGTPGDTTSERARDIFADGERVPMTVVQTFKRMDAFELISSIMREYFRPPGRWMAKGGWIRDKIRNQKFNDLDLYMESNLVRVFKQGLVKQNRLRCVMYETDMLDAEGNEPRTATSVKKNVKLLVDVGDGVKIWIDIQTQETLSNFKTVCDFTCNNFVYDNNNGLSTRVKSKDADNMRWLARCLDDTKRGELVVMTDVMGMSAVAAYKTHQNMCRRLVHMLSMNKGFWYQGATVTGWTPRASIMHESPGTEICVVCHEALGAKSHAVLKCTHTFHVHCLEAWFETGRSNGSRCPMCRQTIDIQYNEEPFMSAAGNDRAPLSL